MEKHPLDQSMESLFPVDLDAYPEPMRQHITRLRELQAEKDHRAKVAASRRRFFSIVIGGFYNLSRLSLLVVGAWFIAQLSDRTPPLRNAVKIITPEVRPGDKLKMWVEPHRLRICETKVTFFAYDGEGSPKTVVMDWGYPAGPVGDDKPFTRPITIPSDAAPGPARLRIERQFRCPFNLVHRWWPIVEISPDMPFTILPRVPR